MRDAPTPDLLATALRESEKKSASTRPWRQYWGTLAPVATVTGYRITPFLGQIPHPYDFHLNPQEVERLLLLPLEAFF